MRIVSNEEKVDGQITGVVVSCNTKDLLKRAYGSVRKFHPKMKIIVIDGSDVSNLCSSYALSLKSEYTFVIQAGYNIGHGRGMCLGIYYAETPHVLLFDSDIEMLKSPVKDMLALMEENTFGVGYSEKIGSDGFDYGARSHHHRESPIRYLHPYFQLLQVKNYKKFYPYVHHGAPCYLTMLDIHNKKQSDVVLKEFPGLGHSSGSGFSWKGEPREYIRHDVAGTRKERKEHGLKEIEGTWEIKQDVLPCGSRGQRILESNRFKVPSENVILTRILSEGVMP